MLNALERSIIVTSILKPFYSKHYGVSTILVRAFEITVSAYLNFNSMDPWYSGWNGGIFFHPPHATSHFPYLLQTSEILWFSGVFSGCRNRPVVSAELKDPVLKIANLLLGRFIVSTYQDRRLQKCVLVVLVF